jgi:hypothetical protein
MPCDIDKKARLMRLAQEKLEMLKELQEDGYEEYYSQGEDIYSVETEIANMQAILEEDIDNLVMNVRLADTNKSVKRRDYSTIRRTTNGHKSAINAYKVEVKDNGDYVVSYQTAKTAKDKTITIPKNGTMKNGTQYNVYDIKDMLAKNDVLGAKASKEKPSFDKFTELEADIHGNPEKMVDLLNKINELDASPETEEHMEYLRGLIKQLNPDFMRKAKTYILESAIENGGMVIGKDIGVMVGRNAKTAGNQQSAAEAYAHEVIHAYTKFAVKLAKDGDVEARKILRELQYVKKVAMENMTWKDFLPKDSIDATKEEAEAKERYDYIFDVNTRGLKDWKPHGHSEDEFMAHILTNPIVSKKAKFIKLKEQHKEMTLWEQAKELFDTITGWLLGDFRFKDRTKNVQELTLELVGMFAEFNNKAVTEARKKENVIEKLKDQFDSIEEDTSAWIGEQLDKILPKEARIGPKPSNPLAQTKWYATAFAKLMLTPIGRKELSKLLKAMGMPMYGSVQSIIRDFVESDQLEKTIDWLALQSDKVDQSKMNIIGTVKQHLKDAFTKPLSDYEEEAITKVLLDTDLQSISKEYTNLQLRNMLTDEETLQKEISKAKHELKMLDEKNYNWHTDQATGLGYYLATGKGHLAQNTSVLGIAKGHLGAEYRRGWKHKKGDLELLLNKVSTLVALAYTGKQEKAKIAELLKTERKGVTTVLDTARFLEKEAKETIFKDQELFMVKGYTKELFDDSMTMEIVPVSKHDEMVKRGFKKIKDMESHSLVRTKEKYAMYVSNAFATNEWHRTATRLTKMQTKGTSLKELYYNEQDSYSEKRHLINKLKIDQARYAIVKSQLDGTFDINSIEYGLMPLLDEYGEVVDYRYMMEKDAKKDLLKQDTGMSNVLGATRGAILDKQDTIEHNKNVLKLIKEDAKENYIEGSDIGKNSMAYILLTPNSINTHIKDLWEVLPKEFKKEAMRNSYKGLAVREDMLTNYFGYRHLSITNVNWLKAITPGFILNMVKIAEAMWIEFIKITKVDILIKMPFVIVGNIISNIMYGISTGSDPMEILRMYRESTIDVRKYLSKHRELIKLEEAGKIGKISQHDKNRIEVLKQELKKSPIHELYELGIYQAIVEDVSQEELSSSNKLKKEYKKRTSAIPKVIKDGMNWIYLTEETQYYKVMTEVLQMSDLVARDIENRKLKKVIEQQAKGEKKIPMWYVNYVENAKDEVATRLQATMVWKDRNRKMDAEERAYFREAAKNYRLNNVLNAFVNYNKPSGSMEEYLNKMGFIMFTKYAKRIQRVIAQTGARYPIRTLMLLLTDAYVLDMDTIQDQSIFTKSWYNLTPQWPLERIMDVFVPPIIQPSTYRII